MLEVISVDDNKRFITCDEGEGLYNYYANCLDDDELCFTQAMKDALEKWHEHQKICKQCEYQ